MSIAGGYYRAVEAAAGLGMSTCQIFTKNNSQWRSKAITDDEVRRFRTALAESGIILPISHASYLINLATPDGGLWDKSIAALVVELQRAEQLGLAFVVVHPGAYTTGTEQAGLERVIRALDEVHCQTEELAVRCLLENTAGQGSSLGWRFEQLAGILAGVRQSDRLGICVDTCHAVAAGYPLKSADDYATTLQTIANTIGLERVKAIHINDSQRELGSRVDRHEHIGRGTLGLESFGHLLNDARFYDTPLYLETPKGHDPVTGEDWDAINLRTLQSLVAPR